MTISPTGGSDMLVTDESIDPRYNEPFVDVNELRNEPVPHRYVNGGFKGTEARFSFYFPSTERYDGRFFHNTYPLAMSEDIGPFPIAFDVAAGDLGFTFDSGAYYVQTNLGGADRMSVGDPAVGAYRVNAAAAKFSRAIAVDLYGAHRPFGYLFGGSGGSYQVMGSAENTSGVWDGFVPYVLGTPNAAPSVFTVRLHALRILRQRNKFPAVMDAINPGGDGDPYAELNGEEKAALKEASLLGFPLRGWWSHKTLNSGYLPFSIGLIQQLDPTYIEDFWTKPGYLGADPTSSIHLARVQFETTVAKVIGGRQAQVEFDDAPAKDFADADIFILSGAGKGKRLRLGSLGTNPASFAPFTDPGLVNSLAPGDRVCIDNSWALALQTYQRHQVPPTTDLYGWNQFRDASGAPIYPQRPKLIGPMSSAGVAGSVPCGRIKGKMLVLQTLLDIDALPWQADWYRAKVQEALGEAFKDNFALWYVDHAQHDNPTTPEAHAHIVSFSGALQQALRDLSAWVEKGVRPLETRYEVAESQINLPAGAAERLGVQPVIELRANGMVRCEVRTGEAVIFTAAIDTPPGAGKVVSAEWDFEGTGEEFEMAPIGGSAESVLLEASHAFSRPGVYFPVLRASSHRLGDAKSPYAKVQNLARVRVVVS